MLFTDLDAPSSTTRETRLPAAAAPRPLPSDRRFVDALIAAATGDSQALPASVPLAPDVRRWMPLAVPLLAALLCAGTLAIWSIL